MSDGFVSGALSAGFFSGSSSGVTVSILRTDCMLLESLAAELVSDADDSVAGRGSPYVTFSREVPVAGATLDDESVVGSHEL